jgi:hypothetical protein
MFSKILIANHFAERSPAAEYTLPARAARSDFAAEQPCSRRF